MINILHLSDIHIESKGQADRYRVQLENDLSRELNITCLDYLVVSGDIGNFSSAEEYEAAFILLDGIKIKFELNNERVIIVPGNHDLNWDLSEEAYPFVPKSKQPNPLPEGKYVSAGDIGILLRDENLYRKRFADFSELFQRFSGKPYPTDYAEQGILYAYPQDQILFLALNTNWEIDHFHHRRASANMDALHRALDKMNSENYEGWLKIAVWHHSLKDLEIANKSDFLEQLAVQGFQLILHGHLHEAGQRFYNYDPDRGIHIIGAGSFGAPSDQQVSGIPLQYNLLQYNPEIATINVETRKKDIMG